jgi:hypothetical protein
VFSRLLSTPFSSLICFNKPVKIVNPNGLDHGFSPNDRRCIGQNRNHLSGFIVLTTRRMKRVKRVERVGKVKNE